MNYTIGIRPPVDPIQIRDASQAAKMFKDLAELPDEVYAAIYLDSDLMVTGSGILASGTLNGVVVGPANILRYALREEKPACFTQFIIVAHNHPGQKKVRPSDDDFHQTTNLRVAAQYLLRPIIDALIIGPDEYYSFAENGKVWKKSHLYFPAGDEPTKHKAPVRIKSDDIRPYPQVTR